MRSHVYLNFMRYSSYIFWVQRDFYKKFRLYVNEEIRFLPSELNKLDVLSRTIERDEPLPTQLNPFHTILVRNGDGGG